MSNKKLLHDIEQARVEAAENVVVKGLRAKGLLPADKGGRWRGCPKCGRSHDPTISACVGPSASIFPETRETIPCDLCATPTPMLGTRRCDRCWELERRIEADPELARKILAAQLVK